MTVDRHPKSLKKLIREKLQETGWDFHEVSYENIERLETIDLESVFAVLLAPARNIPIQYLKQLNNCSLLQVWSSGFDKFNIRDAQSCGLVVANNHGANATSVAEHTLLLMLGVSRRAFEMHQRVIGGTWTGNDHGMSSFSLRGKTLGLLGLGRIGGLVAVRSQAFGMQVVFYDPFVEQDQAPAGVKKVSWETLLSDSDYISLHLHHTETTRGMIDETAFAQMRREPFIINASRAELIDKDSLIRALRAGKIKGLGIDAHYQEPTNAQDALWEFQNIFASPHVAGSTIDSYAETVDACIANIKIALSGEKPQGVLAASP